MRKINVYTYILAAVALLTASCQNHEEMDGWDDPDIVQVNASIAGLQTRANTEEKGDTWTMGDKIRVTNTSSNAIAGKEKADFKYQDNSFVLTADSYAVWVDGENTFEAYYPSGGMAGFDSFILRYDQSTVDKLRENDWMTASATLAKPADNRLNLTFQHELSKVVVKITKYNDQYNNALPKITNPVFGLASVEHEGNNKNYVNPYPEEVNPYMQPDDTEGKHTFTAILFPGKYQENDTFLKFEADDTECQVLPNSMLLTTGLEKGKAYTFNLTVGKGKVEISSVSVDDWTTGTLDDGTADEVVDPSADAATHTVTMPKAGTLTEELIKEALGSGTNLTLKGKMSEKDFNLLKNYLLSNHNSEDKAVNLDLSGLYIKELPGNVFSEGSTGNDHYYIGDVKLPTGIETIGGAAFCRQTQCRITNWNELTHLLSIGAYAFENNRNDGDLVLPSTLTTLDEQAFARNKITGIVVPEGVTQFSNQTFDGCSQLKTIVYKGNIKRSSIGVFDNCPVLESIDLSACTTLPMTDLSAGTKPENITVYVKDTMKAAFEADYFWKQFKIEVKSE